MGPYLAALPVLPQDRAREGSGGAGSSREGACGVAGVEGSGGSVSCRDGVAGFCGVWFHLCYSWMIGHQKYVIRDGGLV